LSIFSEYILLHFCFLYICTCVFVSPLIQLWIDM
jgi:hypothetical protein